MGIAGREAGYRQEDQEIRDTGAGPLQRQIVQLRGKSAVLMFRTISLLAWAGAEQSHHCRSPPAKSAWNCRSAILLRFMCSHQGSSPGSAIGLPSQPASWCESVHFKKPWKGRSHCFIVLGIPCPRVVLMHMPFFNFLVAIVSTPAVGPWRLDL